MPGIETTPYSIAQRYIGLEELQDQGQDHPFIQWCFSLCGMGMNTKDEVPWCAAFMQHGPWELRLPRSKSAAARSWLQVGTPVPLERAVVGFDIVVLQRGDGKQPGPEVIAAPGHVGLFAGLEENGKYVLLLGGNQGDMVNISRFNSKRVLGVRRLA
jgi:uncharacterized protein (TIGR02594 family)